METENNTLFSFSDNSISRPIIDVSYFIPPPEDYNNMSNGSSRMFKTGEYEFSEEQLENYLSDILDYTRNNFSPGLEKDRQTSAFLDTLEEYLNNLGKMENNGGKGAKGDKGEGKSGTELGPGEKGGNPEEVMEVKYEEGENSLPGNRGNLITVNLSDTTDSNNSWRSNNSDTEQKISSSTFFTPNKRSW